MLIPYNLPTPCKVTPWPSADHAAWVKNWNQGTCNGPILPWAGKCRLAGLHAGPHTLPARSRRLIFV